MFISTSKLLFAKWYPPTGTQECSKQGQSRGSVARITSWNEARHVSGPLRQRCRTRLTRRLFRMCCEPIIPECLCFGEWTSYSHAAYPGFAIVPSMWKVLTAQVVQHRPKRKSGANKGQEHLLFVQYSKKRLTRPQTPTLGVGYASGHINLDSDDHQCTSASIWYDTAIASNFVQI